MSSLLWIIGLIVVAIITAAIGSGSNGAAMVSAIIFFPTVIALYFAPTIVAVQRRQHNTTAIAMLNIFGGWTLIGWIVALVWAHASAPVVEQAAPPARQVRPAVGDTKRCSFCAEDIKVEAILCRFCGRNVEPARGSGADYAQTATLEVLDDAAEARKYRIEFDGQLYAYGKYKYAKLADALAYARKTQVDAS